MGGDRNGKRRGLDVRGASSTDRLFRQRDHLDPAFFARPAEFVARDLLGMIVTSTIDDLPIRCRIVETEAYTGPEDDASHAAARIGRTKRNAAMWGPAGVAYVYRIYGIHWCLNAVTAEEGHPSAVLIRAAEPIEGIEHARSRRGPRPDRDLMRGPGNLCAALGITGSLDHHPFSRPPLVMERGVPVPLECVARGPRIGITRSADLPLRFWIAASPWVSGRSQPSSHISRT